MPSTKCIIIRQRICFAKSRDKEMFIYAASGPLDCSLHLHRVLCNNAGLLWSVSQSASEATRTVCKNKQLCFQM